jgi:uracil-DNA glycosylase
LGRHPFPGSNRCMDGGCLMFSSPVSSAGPPNARIFCLGEAPGEREVELGQPFVGPSGYELRRMLTAVGVSLSDCYKANVFSRRPAENNLSLFGTGENPCEESRALGPLTRKPVTWIQAQFLPELVRVREEILAVSPNVILALGNTACWALGLGTGINNLRGTVHPVTIGDRVFKVLPTFHPAAVLRQYSDRVIAIADLEKCHVESASPDVRFDNTELWLDPTLADLDLFDRLHMRSAVVCATDVETRRGQITCISFSPTNADASLCVPFWVDGPSPNYWPSDADEVRAWAMVRHWLERRDLTKVMQNGLYDIQYMLRHGIQPMSCTEDTMLAHHSLYSELRKGLGFLGSVYANTPSWKTMRTFKREELLKAND